MPIALLDALEGADLAIGFWAFLLSPHYRDKWLAQWRTASVPRRWWLGLNAAISTTVGIGIPVLLLYLAIF